MAKRVASASWPLGVRSAVAASPFKGPRAAAAAGLSPAFRSDSRPPTSTDVMIEIVRRLEAPRPNEKPENFDVWVRAVIPGARADDLVNVAMLREGMDRPANLERSGRDVGFELEEDVVAG